MRQDVERALAFITACQVDPNCTLEDDVDHAEEVMEGASSRNYIGLKAILALSFIPMTVLASYIPALFMRAASYNVRSHLERRPYLHASDTTENGSNTATQALPRGCALMQTLLITGTALGADAAWYAGDSRTAECILRISVPHCGHRAPAAARARVRGTSQAQHRLPGGAVFCGGGLPGGAVRGAGAL